MSARDKNGATDTIEPSRPLKKSLASGIVM
jgi:hypothetical protein